MGRILITGGTGYVGQYLVNYFSSEDVYITTRNSKKEKERKMVLEDEETIKDVCKDMDIVVHTAVMDERLIPQKPKEALLVNAYGTRNLYLDAMACGVKKFVYLSTFHVYGNVAGKTITEESPVSPISDYALTHLFAEQYMRQLYRENGMQTVILRMANGIGLPGKEVEKWYLVINDFCRTVVKNKKITMKSNGLPRRDFIPMPDICRAVDTVLKTDIDLEMYNVSSQKTFSIREIAFLVRDVYKELTGCDAQVELPEVSSEEIQQVKDFTICSQKLRSLGWEPQESMEKTIEKILLHELKGKI